MAWNPTPEVADCRDIARKWKKEQVIIIAIDDKGAMQMATFGKDRELCACAGKLGDIAFDAIQKYVARVSCETIWQDSPMDGPNTLQGTCTCHNGLKGPTKCPMHGRIIA